MLQRSRGISAVVAVLAVAVSGVCLIVPGAARAADDAAALYNPDAVYVIHLTLPEQGIEELEAEPDEYAATKGQFSIAATGGTPGTVGPPSAPVPVEIRLKGSASFEDLDGKAAFKLKFAKADRPSAFGQKKMTLNNMVEDSSMVHETMAYEAFRAVGVPASRTGFAYVYLNGLDYGMHLNLETLDDQALERIFNLDEFDPATQHLFEAEDGDDLLPGKAGEFEPDEGEGQITDLEALIDAVNSSGPEPWSTRVAPHAELDEMTRMWAVEKYIGHWDGYSGEAGVHQPNNYYLYDDPQGRFQMLPWGTDETFMESHHLAFDGEAGVMFDKCLEDATCLDLYWHALDEALPLIDGLDLSARAMALDSMLAPWQELEEGNGERHQHSRNVAHAAAQESSEFAAERPDEADEWLTAHAPEDEEGEGGEEEGGEGEEEGGGDEGGEKPGGEGGNGSEGGGATGGGSGIPLSGGAASGSEVGSGPSAPGPRLRRTRVSGNAVRASITVPTGGSVVGLRASYQAGKRRRVACEVPAKSRAAGDLMLECHLRRAALIVLHGGDLDLRIVTTVRTSSGQTTVFRRHLVIAKR